MVVCQRCGSVDDYRTEPSGPHIKAICNGCDRYIKFIKKPLPDVQPVTNNMATLLTGSLCLTDLVEKAKAGHSAFSRGKNGKVYLNFVQWLNDEEDQYGNHSSFQLNSKKEEKDKEGKVYFGNAKKQTAGAGEPVKAGEVTDSLDNLPF